MKGFSHEKNAHSGHPDYTVLAFHSENEGEIVMETEPDFRTRSAMSSSALAPCMTMTLAAISSALYAAAMRLTAKTRSR